MRRMNVTMFQTLDQVAEDIRKSLTEAAHNRRSPMHTPVVGTADADVRVMVLRAFDAKSWTCRLHTDARSPKCDVIGEGAPVGLLFHDPDAKIQIRVKGVGRIEREGPVADAAWAEATNFAKRCYLAEGGPGTLSEVPTSGLPDEVEGVKPDDAQLLLARANFAVLLVELRELDWLWLGHEGHRRARFTCGAGDWLGSWVVP